MDMGEMSHGGQTPHRRTKESTDRRTFVAEKRRARALPFISRSRALYAVRAV
jgi:hypothetical protein